MLDVARILTVVVDVIGRVNRDLGPRPQEQRAGGETAPDHEDRQHQEHHGDRGHDRTPFEPAPDFSAADGG